MSDRLAVWGIGRDREISRVDFTTVPARSSGDVVFRVKNLSLQYTAVGATVSFDGAQAHQFYLSTDGQRFAATLDLGDLPAAATSPVLTLRRVTPSDAPTGAQVATLRVQAASWQLAVTPLAPAAPLIDDEP